MGPQFIVIKLDVRVDPTTQVISCGPMFSQPLCAALYNVGSPSDSLKQTSQPYPVLSRQSSGRFYGGQSRLLFPRIPSKHLTLDWL